MIILVSGDLDVLDKFKEAKQLILIGNAVEKYNEAKKLFPNAEILFCGVCAKHHLENFKEIKKKTLGYLRMAKKMKYEDGVLIMIVNKDNIAGSLELLSLFKDLLDEI